MKLLEVLESQIKNDITFNTSGTCFCNIKTIATIAGVDEKLLKMDLAGATPAGLPEYILNDYEGEVSNDDLAKEVLPDYIVSSIVRFYAYKAGKNSTDQARVIVNTVSQATFKFWLQRISKHEAFIQDVIKNLDLDTIPREKTLQFQSELFKTVQKSGFNDYQIMKLVRVFVIQSCAEDLGV